MMFMWTHPGQLIDELSILANSMTFLACKTRGMSIILPLNMKAPWNMNQTQQKNGNFWIIPYHWKKEMIFLLAIIFIYSSVSYESSILIFQGSLTAFTAKSSIANPTLLHLSWASCDIYGGSFLWLVQFLTWEIDTHLYFL